MGIEVTPTDIIQQVIIIRYKHTHPQGSRAYLALTSQHKSPQDLYFR